MIQEQAQDLAARPHAAGDLFAVLDRLSIRDQNIMARLVQRVAALERTVGEDAALAAAERLEMILRGRSAG